MLGTYYHIVSPRRKGTGVHLPQDFLTTLILLTLAQPACYNPSRGAIPYAPVAQADRATAF